MITYTFAQIGSIVGFPVAVFMASVMVLAFLRIALSFVFRIFKLNLNYKTMLKHK